jgi:uncharacterized protein YbaP (TraB family)
MIKQWVLAALAAAFASVAYADDKPPPAPPAASTEASPLTPVRPALFAARDEDSTIYLFGTVHIRRPGSEWGGPAAQAALAEADEVWTEMEISDATRQEVQVLVFNLGFAPPDQPLSRILNKAERAELEAAIARTQFQPAMFERMRPWLAALMLSVGPMVQAGYQPSAGVDNAVAAAAGDAQMRAFETAEQQINFFANLSEGTQREFLLNSIRSANEAAAAHDVTSDAWERGDLSSLESTVMTDFRGYPELYQVLITQRNQAWVDTLMHELEGSGVDFVAVGAAHLLGADGLVELLRGRGVSVERVE